MVYDAYADHRPKYTRRFWNAHPETKVAFRRWLKRVKAAHWTSADDVLKSGASAGGVH